MTPWLLHKQVWRWGPWSEQPECIQERINLVSRSGPIKSRIRQYDRRRARRRTESRPTQESPCSRLAILLKSANECKFPPWFSVHRMSTPDDMLRRTECNQDLEGHKERDQGYPIRV